MTQSKAAQSRSSAPSSRGLPATPEARLAALSAFALAAFLFSTAPAFAQGPGGTSTPTGASATGAGAVAAGQTQLYNASGSNGATVDQNSYKGSLISGTNTGTILPLSLDEAIQRGLKQNLGIILQSSAVQSANGSRLEQLQQLLPTITADAQIQVQQVDLASYGLKIPNFNPIIGPFQTIDFRASLTQNVVNLNALQTYISSKHGFAASKLTAEDARDMVVLTVGNAYLLCIADQARIVAINAALKTAKLTYDQAVDSHDAGVSPRLDVLRAQVDYQSEQQNLISSQNQLAKDKIALARAIGLPLDQQFELTDTAPYKGLDNLDPNLDFEEALKTRKDLAAAAEQVKSAESARKAAYDDRLPTAQISGNFGDIGETANHSHGTYTATGTISVPVLQIVKDRGEQQVANAALAQTKARLSDATQQVNADVRSAILDIQSAAKLVEATKSNVDLATEALSEAQQRFHAGVADNLPVSQAQTTFEQANDQYISALYQHNVAKLSLARALGVAQTNYKDYLGGK
jgi:outer membrane protein TolC